MYFEMEDNAKMLSDDVDDVVGVRVPHSSAITSIPPEIIAEIFMLSHNSSTQIHGVPHISLVVSHVSELWRNLAISLRPLWTTITVFARSPLLLPYLYVSRTHGLPLCLIVDLRPGHLLGIEAGVVEAGHFLTGELERIRRLIVQTDQLQQLANLFSTLKHVVPPTLAALHILFGGNGTSPFGGSTVTPIFEDGSPELQTMVVIGVSPSFLYPSFSDLTRLHIFDVYAEMRMEYEDYMDMLRGLIHLQFLIVHGSVVVGIAQAVEDEPVELGHLQSLRLIGTDASDMELGLIARSISAPALADLMMENLSPGLADLFTRSLSERPQIWHGFPILARLTFSDCSFTAQDYVQCFKAFPSVTELTLLGAADATYSTLRALQSEPAISTLLPGLESIILPATTSPAHIVSFLDDRRDNAHPIRHLSLRKAGLNHLGVPEAGIVVDLRRRVALRFIDRDGWDSLDVMLSADNF